MKSVVVANICNADVMTFVATYNKIINKNLEIYRRVLEKINIKTNHDKMNLNK